MKKLLMGAVFLATMVVLIQPAVGLGVDEGQIDVSFRIAKVAVAPDGTLFVLPKGYNVIQTYQGQDLQDSIFIGDCCENKVTNTLDFVLDEDGTIHALAISPSPSTNRPEAVICRITREGTKHSTEVVRLDESVQAWSIAIGSGNDYYLLGTKSDTHFDIAEGKTINKPLTVIHRYSPEGKYRQSMLQIRDIENMEDYLAVASSFMQRNNFVADGFGNVWFLYQSANGNGSDPEWERTFYSVNKGGISRKEVLASPGETYRPFGILNDGDEVAVQWIDSGRPEASVVAATDGRVLAEDVAGRVAAMNSPWIVADGLLGLKRQGSRLWLRSQGR